MDSGPRMTEQSVTQEMFRNIYAESPIGIELYDHKGELVDVNRSCIDMFGVVDPGEIKGFKLFEDPNLTDELKKNLLRGETVRYEWPFDFEKVKAHRLYRTTKSGTIDLSVLITPMAVKGGVATGGYLVQVQDITGRKKAEAELRRYQEHLEDKIRERTLELKTSNEKLQKETEESRKTAELLRDLTDRLNAILHASPEAILTLTPDGIVTLWNKAAERIFGWSSEEVVGKFNPIVPGDKLEEFRAFRERVLQGEAYQGSEVRRRKKDGSVITVSISTAPLRDCAGGIYGIVALITDIHERKRTEKLLRESEEKYRLLVNNIPAVTWISDSEGEPTFISPVVEKVYGFAPEEIYAGGEEIWFGRIHPDEVEKVKNNYAALFREDGFFDIEYRIRHKKGNWIWIHDKAIGRFTEKGKQFAYGFFSDVTGRKAAEEELARYRYHLEELVAQRTKELSVMNDQLRQSQKLEAVGLLAGGIAHDFSNILTTIKGSMYIIQKSLRGDSQTMKYVEQVVTSINKANNLSQGLLAFSRKQTITLQPLYVNEIIRKVAKLLSQIIGEHIELTMMLTDRNPTVLADINQMEQVLINLAANARDAMPEGGSLTIGTEILEMDEEFRKEHGYGVPGRYALITVRDTGTGIAEEIREKIFEPFFTTKALGKGSGLGLAVTYGIIKQHNGFVDVASVPRGGTTFRIYIPTAETEVVQLNGRDSPPAAGGTETILLVEDDANTRMVIGEMLKMTGYNVLEAEDGEDALRVFLENEERISLVFLDVRMPKKDGREVYKEIRKVNPESKFLFMSGYTADILGGNGITEESFNFISKAALPEEILRKIRDVLDT